MSIMCNYCPWNDCHYASKDCPVCLRVLLDRSSSPAPSPSQADVPPTPPSRIQNAASENGAASFLVEVVASNIEDLIHRVNKGLEADLTKGDLGWLVAARQAIGRMKRIEVSGVVSGHAIEEAHLSKNTTGMAAHAAPALGNEQGGIGTESENSRAGLTTGLTSFLTREQALQLLDRYATAAMDRKCGGEGFQGYLDIAMEACFKAFGIDAAKARSLDAPESLVGRESQNSGGKIDKKTFGTAKQGGPEPPIRIAVDPWQGLGKTWSDK